MSHRHVVDAHPLIWHLEANSRLGANARAVLSDPHNELFLPIIALAEACWIVEHGRCRIPSIAHLLGHVDADSRIALIPLDRAILDLSLTLTMIGERHDRQIVATALKLSDGGEQVSLLTRDENIRLSGLVTTVW
jgi:PIN domain nuclease of toxin-antitoxin system